MARSTRLLTAAALILATTAMPADGQDGRRGPRRPPIPLAGQVVKDDGAPAAADGSAPAAPPGVEELLRRLEELESRAAAPPERRTSGLVLMLEDSRLASTNYYDPEGIRYFLARLILINLTDGPLAIPSREIVLSADGAPLYLTDAAEALSRTPLQIGNQYLMYEAPPETITVPSRGSAPVWVAFAGIESAAAVPPLKLSVTWEQGTESLDVNAYERGVLGLRSERLGPKACAALLTVGGELNTVNAATLTDALDELSAEGVVRAVLAWGEGAQAPDEHVLEWLRSARSQETGLQYAQMPQIPAAISEFHIVQPPGSSVEGMSRYGQTAPVHRDVESAMAAALKTAIEAMPRDELRNELARGHRLSRGAALALAGARLGRRELPLVLAACDDADEYVRLQALGALGQYNDPQAIDRLMTAASAADQSTRLAAVASLAGSRFPAAHAALTTHLDALDAPQTAAIVDVLARFPRRELVDRIAGYYRSSDPQLQLAALRALVRLGHPEIVGLLSAALESGDADLRAEAYTQLVQRFDARSEEIAMKHALTLLASAPPDANTYALLMRTRDRRAIPLLLRQLDALEGGRESLINLVAQIDGAEAFPALLSRYPQLAPTEKSAVLEALYAGKSPEARSLALAALTSREPQLVDVATRIVSASPDAETVTLLERALEQTPTVDAWNVICGALANIGDQAAREVLLRARRTEDRQLREQVIGALTRIKHSSPAFQYAFQAGQAIDAGDRTRAEKLLDLAISFDPDFAEAYARRGHLRLLRQDLAQAGADFERASALDPFDSLAVTGKAIVTVMQGAPRDGVEQVRAVAEQFPGDAAFQYNVACVYGRAIEQLQKSTADADAALRSEYQSAGLQHLRSAMQLGFDSIDFIRNDPDLAVFADVPEFQSLLAKPPAPAQNVDGDDETISVPGGVDLNIGTLK